MTGRALCRLLLVLVSLTTLCHGSKINFTATPATFSEGVTPTLTLRCDLEDEKSSNNNVVRVTSIVIRRVEDSIQREVVRIVTGSAAIAGSWAAGASVTGDLSNTVGHLKATWSTPKQLQAGRYSCEIVAREQDGTNIKFKSNLQVEGTSQTVGDLVKSLSEAKDEIEALKQAIGDLKTNGNPVDKKFILECKSEIAALKHDVSDAKASVDGNNSAHSEQGLVVFDHSNTWGDSCKPREMVKYVRFSVAYAKVPVVSISSIGVDVDANTKYRLRVTDLTTSGFTIICSTWWDTIINTVEVQWTSVVA